MDALRHRSPEALADTLAPAWDRETTRHLSTLGLGPGWRCATTATHPTRLLRWLDAAVGPSGCVLTRGSGASDLRSVRAIGADPLPGGLDLVHVRAVRAAALDALPSVTDAVRTGGWVVLEAFDWSEELIERDVADTLLGRRLPTLLRAHGLEDVGAAAHIEVDTDLAETALSPPMVTAWGRRPHATGTSATDRRGTDTLAAGRARRREG